MKVKAFYAAILILLLLVPACRAQEAPPRVQNQSLSAIQVFFSPKGGCTEAVVKELDAAKATILVQAYSFTSRPSPKPWSMPTSEG